MTNAHIRDAALELGFTHAAFTDAAPFPAWGSARHPPYIRLNADPKTAMPEARSIVTLAMCYEPYAPAPAGYADISAYYVASNTSYGMTRRLAEIIRAAGARALETPAIPEKPACVRAGMGAYGLNQQVLLEDGARPCVLHTILTDMELDTRHEDETARAQVCASCAACVKACPTRALDGGYDLSRCIRNYMFTSFAVPEAMRPYMGKRLLGCDACLAACARGARRADMPQELLGALRIDGLLEVGTLSEQLKVLARYIGANYARANRVLAHAVIVAANEGDPRRMPAIKALFQHEDGVVREHARWAYEALQKDAECAR